LFHGDVIHSWNNVSAKNDFYSFDVRSQDSCMYSPSPGNRSLRNLLNKYTGLLWQIWCEKRRLELRVDAFNALNHTQFSGVNSNLNFTSLTNLTPTNLPFDANGNFIFNNRNGFVTVSGVRDPRILQMVARFVF